MDLKAVNHILMDSYTYYRPISSGIFFRQLLGNGEISHGVRNIHLAHISLRPYRY